MWILTYTVTIKIYVDRPHVAAVPNSVQAQLEEMRQSVVASSSEVSDGLEALSGVMLQDVVSKQSSSSGDFCMSMIITHQDPRRGVYL